MASVNKVIIVGNLGKDPEMRSFPSGDQVANVTIATTDTESPARCSVAMHRHLSCIPVSSRPAPDAQPWRTY